MTKQLVTTKFGVNTAENFVLEVTGDDSAFYVFAGKPDPYSGISDQIVPAPYDSVRAGTIDTYDGMVFGKKVQETDVAQMAPRYDWAINTTYTMYDDLDVSLAGSKYYACVNTDSTVNIYKCLYNGGGRPSTVEPSGTDAAAFESPVDGYVWKYMCSANDYTIRQFATNDFIPIVANSSVVASAVPGSIEVIAIDSAGAGYNNYLIDSFGSVSAIKVGGNPYLYALPAAASSVDDFYNGCMIKITSGAAVNEYKLIMDYYIVNGQKVISLDSVFENDIQPADTFEIYPYVYVFDNGGHKQSNCIARAIISPETGNSVSKIDILSPGSGYRDAITLIGPNPVVPVVFKASLRSIISPPGGHGSDPAIELNANRACVSVKFIGDEAPFTTENDYRTVGLIKNPLFSNVQILTSNAVGGFSVGETVYQYKPLMLNGSASTTLFQANVAGNDTAFTTALNVGDAVIVSTGSENIFANVIAIANSTLLTLNKTVPFAANGCTITYVKDAKALGKCSSLASQIINIDNMNAAKLSTTPYLVGDISNATAMVDQNATEASRVTINGRNVGDFSKFSQLTKVVGVVSSGTFIADEIITQNTDPYVPTSALMHSVIDANTGSNDIMYLTNVKGYLVPQGAQGDGVIVGTSSGAQFTVMDKYNGELVPDTGEVLYMENLSPVTRANNKTETIKLIIEFK
jgi:hypothetical protein